MSQKIGDKTKFTFAKEKKITDIKNVDFEYIIESTFGVCPNCGHQLGKRQTFKIIKLVIIGNKEYFVGYSNKGHTLKLEKENIPEELIG
jgi:ssDNA-binding Zn-finger/Zn-ribbon topoisomerase 1